MIMIKLPGCDKCEKAYRQLREMGRNPTVMFADTEEGMAELCMTGLSPTAEMPVIIASISEIKNMPANFEMEYTVIGRE